MTKKNPTRPGPKQLEIWDYLISDDLKLDSTWIRMTRNPRRHELIRTRNLTRPDLKWPETRPDPWPDFLFQSNWSNPARLNPNLSQPIWTQTRPDRLSPLKKLTNINMIWIGVTVHLLNQRYPSDSNITTNKS
jgi:hypothetical protein